MKKFKRWMLFLTLFSFLAFVTNPSFESHKKKLEAKYTEQNPLSGFIGVGKIITSLVVYHDVILFSYTTERIKNNKVSFGFLGMVWVVDLDIDKLKLNV